MFWVEVAGVYDLFANVINRKTHKELKKTVENADILSLRYPDDSFDVVVARNVIHLLDEPLNALSELDRVCRKGGRIVIPTYMNKTSKGTTTGFSAAVGKAGADFKREFTLETYKAFFREAGYENVEYIMIQGRVPCAVAVITL